jgi:hypothetical protein
MTIREAVMLPVARVTPPVPTACACSQCDTGTTAELPGRLLVESAPERDPAGQRPSATFLAQLIATAQRAPQTRQRRRAEPHEVTAIYAAVATPAASLGRTVNRAL